MTTQQLKKDKGTFAVYGQQQGGAVPGAETRSSQRDPFMLTDAATPGMTPRYLSEDEYGWGRDLLSARDWMLERANAGASGAPIPMPIIDYEETRDPKTGNYLSQSVSGQFHPALEAIGQRYLGTLNDRYQHDMAASNAVRDRVRAAATPISYVDPRIEQSLDWWIQFDPSTGQNRVMSRNTYTPIYETRYAPFLDPGINYV